MNTRFRGHQFVENLDVLLESVASYLRQLGEFKEDNNIELADRHKSAGFMLSWLIRLKPVQILVSSDDLTEKAPEEYELLANEMFAIQAAFSCLDVEVDLVGDYDFFDSLIKRLRERECPPEHLSSMLYLYERLRHKPTSALTSLSEPTKVRPKNPRKRRRR